MHTDGPLLIVAGAGTGKTTVITQKIAEIVAKKLAKPEEILALTFTEKAAQEMQDRIEGLLDTGYTDMQVSTFHAFCQRLIENYGLDIGISNQPRLLTEVDAWILIRQNLDKFNLNYYQPMGNPTKYIHELIKHFSKCKDEMISPADYLDYAKNVKLDADHVPQGYMAKGTRRGIWTLSFWGAVWNSRNCLIRKCRTVAEVWWNFPILIRPDMCLKVMR